MASASPTEAVPTAFNTTLRSLRNFLAPFRGALESCYFGFLRVTLKGERVTAEPISNSVCLFLNNTLSSVFRKATLHTRECEC